MMFTNAFFVFWPFQYVKSISRPTSVLIHRSVIFLPSVWPWQTFPSFSFYFHLYLVAAHPHQHRPVCCFPVVLFLVSVLDLCLLLLSDSLKCSPCFQPRWRSRHPRGVAECLQEARQWYFTGSSGMNCKKSKVCLVNMLIQFGVTSLCSKFYFKEANLGALN